MVADQSGNWKLKNFFDERVVRQIATALERVHPSFAIEGFVRECLDGLDRLELTPRGWHIAHALRRHLPEPHEEGVALLVDSLGPALGQTELNGMEPFIYLPHVFFVAKYGLENFEASMRAQHELTQRFSAEYSIRTFIERYPDETYARLLTWARDPSVHVRRLVSEGTRPRLPWAPRLRGFQRDPTPVVRLLELLRDDPELYVRRSVANNLNDIGKDHPALLVDACRAWLVDASPDRRWIVGHALRSLVKAGDKDALALLSFGSAAEIAIDEVHVSPEVVPIGGKVTFHFRVKNSSAETNDLLIDHRVHFVKANGQTSPKVFKLRAVLLPPGASVRLEGRISLAQMTTRRHHPGRHRIEVIVNGMTFPLADFEITEPSN